MRKLISQAKTFFVSRVNITYGAFHASSTRVILLTEKGILIFIRFFLLIFFELRSFKERNHPDLKIWKNSENYDLDNKIVELLAKVEE